MKIPTQVEPIYMSGDSQRADGMTKILSGKALVAVRRVSILLLHLHSLTQVRKQKNLRGNRIEVSTHEENQQEQQR